jgi:hypothetical protein
MTTDLAEHQDGRVDLHVAILVATWLAAVGPLAFMLLSGAAGADRFRALRGVLQGAYAFALISCLADRGPAIARLPTSPLGGAADTPVGRFGAAGAALVLCLVGLLDAGLFLLLLAAATIVLLIGWRRQVTRWAALLGIVASVLAFATGGIAFWRHGFVAKPMLIFMLVAVPPMFVAGGLLVARTGLGAVRVLEGRYRAAGRSFLGGAVFFVPLGLANAASRTRFGPAWVDEWWQPFVLPLWSGLVEEVAFRAVLVCLVFALLQPALRRAPVIAVALSTLVAAAIFGLGHGRTPDALFATGLGYGLPMAVVFVRRDWEHAVGAHYMINFVPWLMALMAG